MFAKHGTHEHHVVAGMGNCDHSRHIAFLDAHVRALPTPLATRRIGLCQPYPLIGWEGQPFGARATWRPVSLNRPFSVYM
jgi:hypothetical protein